MNSIYIRHCCLGITSSDQVHLQCIFFSYKLKKRILEEVPNSIEFR